MAATTVGLGWLEILLFLIGGGGLLGMPPGERDAALLKAAPQQTLLYVEWTGRGSGIPGAAGIDGLVADPEIRSLINAIDAGLNPVASAGDEAPDQHTFQNSLQLAKLVTAHSGCLFVTVDLPPEGDGLLKVPTPLEILARVRICFVVNSGSDAAATIETLGRITQQAIPPQPRMQTIPGPMGLAWTVHQEGNRLLIGVGSQVIERTLAGLAGKTPGLDTNPRFMAGWKRVAPKRVGSVGWFDVRSTVEAALRSVGPAGVFAQVIVNGVGADALDFVVSGSGVVDGAVVQRTFVATGGRTDGVMMVAGSPGLRPEQLLHIPPDSDVMLAASLNPGQLVQGVRELIGKTHPLSVRVFDEAVKELENELMLNLSQDVFPAFGNAWTAFSAPSEGGLVGSGLIVTLEVRDPVKAQAVYARLMQLLEQSLISGGDPDSGSAAEVKHQEFLGHSISYVSGSGLSFGVHPTAIPSFCLTRSHLLFAVHPQVLKAHLRQSNAPRPGIDSVVARKLSLGNDDILFAGYFDGARVVQTLSGLLPFMGQSLAEIAHVQGWKFDPFTIPSTAALVPYAGDVTLSVARVKDGILVESRNPHLGMALVTGFVWARSWLRTDYEVFLEVQKNRPAGNTGLGAAEGQVVPAAAEKPAPVAPAEKTGNTVARRLTPLLLKALVPDGVQPMIPDEVFRRLAEPPSPEVQKQREERRKQLEERRRERLDRRRLPPRPQP